MAGVAPCMRVTAAILFGDTLVQRCRLRRRLTVGSAAVRRSHLRLPAQLVLGRVLLLERDNCGGVWLHRPDGSVQRIEPDALIELQLGEVKIQVCSASRERFRAFGWSRGSTAASVASVAFHALLLSALLLPPRDGESLTVPARGAMSVRRISVNTRTLAPDARISAWLGPSVSGPAVDGPEPMIADQHPLPRRSPRTTRATSRYQKGVASIERPPGATNYIVDLRQVLPDPLADLWAIARTGEEDEEEGVDECDPDSCKGAGGEETLTVGRLAGLDQADRAIFKKRAAQSEPLATIPPSQDCGSATDENGAPRIYCGCRPHRRGALDKEMIRRVIRRNINQIKYCYERELRAGAKLMGKVSVRFVISPLGNVGSSSIAETTMNNTAVEQCIARAVRRWRFPKPRGGGIVVVNYPFMLRAAS